jgi:hypothetical protein
MREDLPSFKGGYSDGTREAMPEKLASAERRAKDVSSLEEEMGHLMDVSLPFGHGVNPQAVWHREALEYRAPQNVSRHPGERVDSSPFPQTHLVDSKASIRCQSSFRSRETRSSLHGPRYPKDISTYPITVGFFRGQGHSEMSRIAPPETVFHDSGSEQGSSAIIPDQDR